MELNNEHYEIEEAEVEYSLEAIREEAIGSAVDSAFVLFNHFEWEVIDHTTMGLVVPDKKHIRRIIESLIDSAEKELEKGESDYPVRVSTARLSVTIWPFQDSTGYDITFDIGSWDVFDENSEWDDSDEE